MITITFYGEPIGDREYLTRSRCTCALDGCCLEHSYAIDDPGDVVIYDIHRFLSLSLAAAVSALAMVGDE